MSNYTEDICQCCGHVRKVWKKALISTAVASLCKLVSMYDNTPIHLDNFTVLAKDRNFNQLVNWGLIRPEINDDGSKRASGYWHPTQLGIDFVMGRIEIPKYIITCENELIGTKGPMMNVTEALRNKFNYTQLIADNR